MRILAFLLTLLTASAESTLSTSSHHAWSANTGWIDLRANPGDGFGFGEFSCSGWIWSPNLGWIHCGDGSPANGIQYANADASDFGVNHTGTGDLYGLAWSSNSGWINFGWATADPGNPDRPRVDLETGTFHGCAWSANCGWINLGAGQLKTDRMEIADTDHDGISDIFEIAYTNGLGAMTTSSDTDGDGFSDKEEYQALSQPLDPSNFFKVTKVLSNGVPGIATELTWTSVPARRYIIERSSDLGVTDPWQASPQDPASFGAGPGSITTHTSHDTPASKRFFRVRVMIPLQP